MNNLSDGHLKRWNSPITKLQTLNSVCCIPRCYFNRHSASLLKSVQLHCFSDASGRAYTAVIYLHSLYEDGCVEVNLITSKTKIAPLKKQSTSRLELLGATILARLAKTVQNALLQKLETVYWVDSMTVLCWIRNTRRWKQYVMSRVQASWNFCPSEQNPADIPTCGSTASELITKDKWWGPEFLYNIEEEWPCEDNAHSENENAMKEIVKNPATITHVLVSGEQVRQTGLHQIIDADRYSSLTKLLPVTACVLHFTRRPKEKRGPELNAEEIQAAEELWIKSIQNQSFPEEVCHLMSTGKTPTPILVRQFDVYIDERSVV